MANLDKDDSSYPWSVTTKDEKTELYSWLETVHNMDLQDMNDMSISDVRCNLNSGAVDSLDLKTIFLPKPIIFLYKKEIKRFFLICFLLKYYYNNSESEPEGALPLLIRRLVEVSITIQTDRTNPEACDGMGSVRIRDFLGNPCSVLVNLWIESQRSSINPLLIVGDDFKNNEFYICINSLPTYKTITYEKVINLLHDWLSNIFFNSIPKELDSSNFLASFIDQLSLKRALSSVDNRWKSKNGYAQFLMEYFCWDNYHTIFLPIGEILPLLDEYISKTFDDSLLMGTDLHNKRPIVGQRMAESLMTVFNLKSEYKRSTMKILIEGEKPRPMGLPYLVIKDKKLGCPPNSSPLIPYSISDLSIKVPTTSSFSEKIPDTKEFPDTIKNPDTKKALPFSQDLAVYAAGFIDADGSLVAQILSKKDNVLGFQIKIYVIVVQKASFLNTLCKEFKLGVVKKRSDEISEWIIVGPEALEPFLKAINPYLRIKNEQSRLMLDLINRLPLIQNNKEKFIEACLLVDKVSAFNNEKRTNRKNTSALVKKTFELM